MQGGSRKPALLRIVEADELDFRRCLEIQSPYLGPVIGEYTDWMPLKDAASACDWPRRISCRLGGGGIAAPFATQAQAPA